MLPRQADLVHHLPIVSVHGRNPWLRSIGRDAEIAFAQDDNFIARDVVFLEGFADDLFGAAVGVNIRLEGGKCESGLHWKQFDNGRFTVSQVFKPTL